MYVRKILDNLKDNWDIARWLTIIIENYTNDDDMIDMLMNVFKKAIAQMKDKQTKNKLEEAKSLLESLKWDIKDKVFTL